MEDIDDEAEEFLEKMGGHVDFEVLDAIEKLLRDELMFCDGPLNNSTGITALSYRQSFTV